jgi:hypothetical protein
LTRRKEKKDEVNQINTKYANQVAQLEADGVKIKNKRLLIQLLEKANGEVDVVKQLLAEKHKEKHQAKSVSATTEGKPRHEINAEDMDNLKRLRSAGVHGNPIKILALFHECNESIEMTIARMEKHREQREQQSEKRTQVKIISIEIEFINKSFVFRLATFISYRNS